MIEQVLQSWKDGMSHGDILDKHSSLTKEHEFAITIGGEGLAIEEIEARLPDVRKGMKGKEILAVMGKKFSVKGQALSNLADELLELLRE